MIDLLPKDRLHHLPKIPLEILNSSHSHGLMMRPPQTLQKMEEV